MRSNVPVLALMLGALLALPHSAALHCNGDIITIATPAATIYIDDRSDEAGELNHWTYLESNGVDGLQSGGNVVIMQECYPLTCLTDPCYGHSYDYGVDPDSLIL